MRWIKNTHPHERVDITGHRRRIVPIKGPTNIILTPEASNTNNKEPTNIITTPEVLNSLYLYECLYYSTHSGVEYSLMI
jgi:hypothetical protein